MFIHVTLYMYVIYVLPGYKTYACVFNAGATPKHVPVNQCLWRWALAPVVFQAMQVTLMYSPGWESSDLPHEAEATS